MNMLTDKSADVHVVKGLILMFYKPIIEQISFFLEDYN